MTEPTPFLPMGEMQRYWQLQRLARKANLRLTTDGKTFHLRDEAGNDQRPADLDAAERILGAGVLDKLAALKLPEVPK